MPEIKPKQYRRPSRKVHFQLRMAAGSVFAAAGAATRRSPGWALCFLSLAQPGERPAAAPAAAKPLAAAGLSPKRPFSEGRPYCLGLISGYLGPSNITIIISQGLLLPLSSTKKQQRNYQRRITLQHRTTPAKRGGQRRRTCSLERGGRRACRRRAQGPPSFEASSSGSY